MSQLASACLEFGLGAPGGTRREPIGGIRQQLFGTECRKNYIGVFDPVGRRVHVAAGGEPQCDCVYERGLQQTPLVMAFLGPGIWKIHVDPGQGILRNHLLEHLDRVMLDHAHIRKLRGLDADKEYAITDLDTNTVTRKQGRELIEQGFTVEIARKPGAALFAYKVQP